MGHIHEGFEKGRGSRSPDQRPFRPPRMCKQRHVDPDLGDAPTPHPTGTASRGGGGRSRETAARQGDPTAFLAGVSAPLPVPVAEISDFTPELGRSPFRERLAFQSEGSVRGRGRVLSTRDRETIPERGRDTRAPPLWAPGLQFPQDERRGGARCLSRTLLGIAVPALGAVAGKSCKDPTRPFYRRAD